MFRILMFLDGVQETFPTSHGRVYRYILKPEVHAVIDSRERRASVNKLGKFRQNRCQIVFCLSEPL